MKPLRSAGKINFGSEATRIRPCVAMRTIENGRYEISYHALLIGATRQIAWRSWGVSVVLPLRKWTQGQFLPRGSVDKEEAQHAVDLRRLSRREPKVNSMRSIEV